MPECAYCKAETELFVSNVPVCTQCSEKRAIRQKPLMSDAEIRNILHREFQRAEEFARAAIAAYDAAADMPTALRQKEGAERLHKASRDVSIARIGMMKAHNRLDDYLSRRIMPEDLKRTG
jgi:DNA-directed RNA polymerase subunit RPC12/RpoP